MSEEFLIQQRIPCQGAITYSLKLALTVGNTIKSIKILGLKLFQPA